MTRGQIVRHNGWQTIVSLDQVLHCFGGLLTSLLLLCIRDASLPVVWADETLSSRCWRWHKDGVRSWPCRCLDKMAAWLGDKDHCRTSYESERTRRQLPPELRGAL